MTLLKPVQQPAFTRQQFFTAIGVSFALGGLLLFFGTQLFFSKSGLPFIQSKKHIQQRFGGPISKKDAQRFTDEFSSYLRFVDPEGSKVGYTAGTYFTAEEIGNYLIQLNRDNPGTDAADIKLYFCLSMYPNQTYNPVTGRKITGPKLGSCIVATKNSANLVRPGTDKLAIENNPDCLGGYNWGNLEP